MIANTNCPVPPEIICPGTKFFWSVGGRATLRTAVGDGAPEDGVCVEVAPLVVFGWAPATLLVTVTVTVQVAPAARLAIFMFSAVAPMVSAGELVAPHVPPTVTLATVMLVSVSEKLIPVSVAALVLRTVTVITLVPPCAIVLGANAFANIVGGTTKSTTATFDGVPAAPLCVEATPDVELL